MNVSANFVDRFKRAHHNFKQEICLQSDALFDPFLAELTSDREQFKSKQTTEKATQVEMNQTTISLSANEPMPPENRMNGFGDDSDDGHVPTSSHLPPPVVISKAKNAEHENDSSGDKDSEWIHQSTQTTEPHDVGEKINLHEHHREGLKQIITHNNFEPPSPYQLDANSNDFAGALMLFQNDQALKRVQEEILREEGDHPQPIVNSKIKSNNTDAPNCFDILSMMTPDPTIDELKELSMPPKRSSGFSGTTRSRPITLKRTRANTVQKSSSQPPRRLAPEEVDNIDKNFFINIPKPTKPSRFQLIGINCPIEGCMSYFNQDGFGALYSFERHLFLRHNIKRFPCFVSGCDQSFDSSKEIAQHIEMNHNKCDNGWLCCICDTLIEGDYFQLHFHTKNQHFEIRAQCMFTPCSYIANFRTEAIAHLHQEHLDDGCRKAKQFKSADRLTPSHQVFLPHFSPTIPSRTIIRDAESNLPHQQKIKESSLDTIAHNGLLQIQQQHSVTRPFGLLANELNSNKSSIPATQSTFTPTISRPLVDTALLQQYSRSECSKPKQRIRPQSSLVAVLPDQPVQPKVEEFAQSICVISGAMPTTILPEQQNILEPFQRVTSTTTFTNHFSSLSMERQMRWTSPIMPQIGFNTNPFNFSQSQPVQQYSPNVQTLPLRSQLNPALIPAHSRYVNNYDMFYQSGRDPGLQFQRNM